MAQGWQREVNQGQLDPPVQALKLGQQILHLLERAGVQLPRQEVKLARACCFLGAQQQRVNKRAGAVRRVRGRGDGSPQAESERCGPAYLFDRRTAGG